MRVLLGRKVLVRVGNDHVRLNAMLESQPAEPPSVVKNAPPASRTNCTGLGWLLWRRLRWEGLHGVKSRGALSTSDSTISFKIK
jgi:hypothetical protein